MFVLVQAVHFNETHWQWSNSCCPGHWRTKSFIFYMPHIIYFSYLKTFKSLNLTFKFHRIRMSVLEVWHQLTNQKRFNLEHFWPNQIVKCDGMKLKQLLSQLKILKVSSKLLSNKPKVLSQHLQCTSHDRM